MYIIGLDNGNVYTLGVEPPFTVLCDTTVRYDSIEEAEEKLKELENKFNISGRLCIIDEKQWA